MNNIDGRHKNIKPLYSGPAEFVSVDGKTRVQFPLMNSQSKTPPLDEVDLGRIMREPNIFPGDKQAVQNALTGLMTRRQRQDADSQPIVPEMGFQP